jgi:ABC-type multidrug transport system ATPase subunit
MRHPCQRGLVYHAVVSAILASSSLRVDVAGQPAIDGITLRSTGQRILVLGAPRALFEAAAGLRAVEHGELSIAGASLRSSRTSLAAAAPLDPRMPSGWTVSQYVTWSARLSGLRGPECQSSVFESLEKMRLLAHRFSRLGKVPLAVRRLTAIGAAMATGARVLLLEDPSAGLSDDVERSFARVVASAMRDRPTLVFAGRVALDSPIALAADEAIVLDGSHVVAQGAPAEIAARENSFAVQATGNVAGFAQALAGQGCRLGPSEPSADESRFTVDLHGIGTRDLLRVAEASDAVVLELRPLNRVFA